MSSSVSAAPVDGGRDPIAERVLVVDDDADIRESLEWRLETAGYEVRTAGTGMAAIDEIAAFGPDLVLLDLKLPDVDGIEVLRRLRQFDEHTLVVLLSGQADETDRIVALEIGADAILQKPCGPREVSACVRSMLRRRILETSLTGPGSSHSGLTIDRETRTVRLDGNVIDLTRTEFDLLAFLASSSGTVFARHELLEQVWRMPGVSRSEASVTELVRRLRSKLEPTPAAHRWIATVRGHGYAFRPPSANET